MGPLQATLTRTTADNAVRGAFEQSRHQARITKAYARTARSVEYKGEQRDPASGTNGGLGDQGCVVDADRSCCAVQNRNRDGPQGAAHQTESRNRGTPVTEQQIRCAVTGGALRLGRGERVTLAIEATRERRRLLRARQDHQPVTPESRTVYVGTTSTHACCTRNGGSGRGRASFFVPCLLAVPCVTRGRPPPV